MFTTAPAPCCAIKGNTCLHIKKTLLRLWSIWVSHTSSLISTGPPAAEPPTLLTSTSMRPKRAKVACTAAWMEAVSVTSQVMESISPPCWLSTAWARSRVSAKRSWSRSSAMTLAPSCTMRAAMARPLPQPGPTEPAPVTSTTLSCSRPVMSNRFLFKTGTAFAGCPPTRVASGLRWA